MGPVGPVPSNSGDQVYLVVSNFYNWLPFSLGTVLWEAYSILPQTSLLNFRGEGKKSGKVRPVARS